MLDQTYLKVLVQGGVNSLTMTSLLLCGQDMTDALPFGTESTKGIKEQEPKYVLGLEKSQLFHSVHPRLFRWLQGDSPGCERHRSQM